MREEVLELVNHEPWIECEENRAYLKWGHYPETEGMLNPKSIRRTFVTDLDGNGEALVIGSGREAPPNGSLFLEFNTEKDVSNTIIVE
jgi:hypothetical protein